jgi:hypothetical protein
LRITTDAQIEIRREADLDRATIPEGGRFATACAQGHAH